MKRITHEAASHRELTTEEVDPRYEFIDRMSVAELAQLMNEADAAVPGAVAAALPSIVTALEATSARMKAGGRLIYVGAGTPGRIGVLDASECPPTFGTAPDRVFAIIAGGTGAIVSPMEGAEDDAVAGAEAIDAAGVNEHDSVVGIASSGRTPYVIGAVRRARELGAATVGLSCNEGSQLSDVAQYPIEVLVGPEFISGSTRLKAGTAQKLVLNMFSTIGMVQLGKTYGNLMVDVRATNEKLRRRAVRIVSRITGASNEQAAEALESCGYRVKPAVIMIKLGLDPILAEERIAAADGRLRVALGEAS